MTGQCDHQLQTSKKVKLSGKKRETPPAGCDGIWKEELGLVVDQDPPVGEYQKEEEEIDY